jgi:hypothetical protein
MKKRNVLIAAGLTAIGALAGAGLKALADGISSPNPLYYAGTLSEGGALVNGTRSITVNLWSDGTTSGSPLCTTVAPTADVINGRFRISLAGSCKTVVNQNASVWVEVIDGATSLGRSPVGAVPYAVEADHAVNATSAVTAATANAAGGTLATTLSMLQGQAHPASGLHSRLTTALSVASGHLTPVAFDVVDFDSNGEYDVTSGAFKPKSAGVYLVTCEFQYVMSTNTSACSATIQRNGVEVIALDSPTLPPISGGGSHCVSAVTLTVQAAVGDAIACAAFQVSAGGVAASLDQGTLRNAFSAARIY